MNKKNLNSDNEIYKSQKDDSFDNLNSEEEEANLANEKKETESLERLIESNRKF